MKSAMLSVLIDSLNDEERLASTLATLVGGAVQGVVREVIICDAGSTDGTLKLADEAGCVLVNGTAASGVRKAKSEWLLFLEPGARMVDGWLEPTAAHMARLQIAAHYTRAKVARAPFLSRIFSSNRPLELGMLMRRAQASQKSHGDFTGQDMARGLASRQLSGEIIPVRAERT